MKGEIRLLGCILAQTPEEFYKFYPGAKTKRNGALDYWNRMLGEDKNSVDEYRRKQRERSKAWRDRRKP